MTSKVPGPIGTGPRAPRRPGRWPRNWAALYDRGTPAARVLRADWDAVMPITGPSPASVQIRAASASTRVFPAPAGALSTETSRPSASDGERGGGLVLAQPAARARILRVARVLRLARVARASGQRVRQPRRVRAERARSLRAVHPRRAARAGLRDHAFFHAQLRARGIPGTAVPLVDAAPIRAQQASRHLGGFGRFQAGHRLEVRGQRPVSQVLQHRGGRGRIPAGARQDAAQVLDQVRAGPRALVLLRQRDRLLRGAR